MVSTRFHSTIMAILPILVFAVFLTVRLFKNAKANCVSIRRIRHKVSRSKINVRPGKVILSWIPMIKLAMTGPAIRSLAKLLKFKYSAVAGLKKRLSATNECITLVLAEARCIITILTIIWATQLRSTLIFYIGELMNRTICATVYAAISQAKSVLHPWFIAARKRTTVTLNGARCIFKLILIIGKHQLQNCMLFRVFEVAKRHAEIQIFAFIKELFTVLPHYPSTFDSTLGFPGEGWHRQRKRKRKRQHWSKNEGGLTMATWNTRSMTNERFAFCKQLDYDVLAVTELWRKQDKFTTRSNEFTVSNIIRDKHGNYQNAHDPAAGVGILLSKRAQAKVMAAGSNSERICWVRLRGPVSNIFIIAVYLPHSQRAQPSLDDTLAELDATCKQAGQGDCLVILGDMNVQLPGNMKHLTGGHVCADSMSAPASKLLNLMRQYNLCAANTLFRKRGSPATYLHAAASDNNQGNDQYMGRKVKEVWKGKEYLGRVVQITNESNGTRKWTVKFTDGYIKKYSEKQLYHSMIPLQHEMQEKQLDYILVSCRWFSSVQDAGVRWGPSEHRNIKGRADHALVYCRWKWRLRKAKRSVKKDFAPLLHKGAEGIDIRAKFDDAINSKTRELQEGNPDCNLDKQYENMCVAINHAINTVLPNRESKGGKKRHVSTRTQKLFEQRTNMGRSRKKKWSNGDYDKIQEKIRQSCMQDYKDWVEAQASEMQSANNVGDTRKLYNIVKELSGKVDKKPETDLNIDLQSGKVISSAKERAAVWCSFLQKKFAATEREQTRPEMDPLPLRNPEDTLTYKEVHDAIKTLKNHKAVGNDGIPVEVYKASRAAAGLLHSLLERVWREETVPEALGVAVFKMIYKRKGSPNNPAKYRCIGLLNAAYKVLSAVMLVRLTRETDGFLQDWQAGFRQQRGCRDNVMILRTLVDKMLQEDNPLVLTFIDYSAAFDSVSHKFLDTALGKAKAKPKSRAIFRAIYTSATAKTKVKGVDGEVVYSETFPIRRGVLQGDLTSPLYFIIALEEILRRHDDVAGKGVNFGGVRLHTLGYADDAALIDGSVGTATNRVTCIAQGSEEDADMNINVEKTECMHVQRQQKIDHPTTDQARKVCKFQCKNLGCGWLFGNKHGLAVHRGKYCKRAEYYEVEKILGVRTEVYPIGLGPTEFLIKWQGYNSSENKWIKYENVTKAAIDEYLHTNRLYDHQWKHRCHSCGKPCRTAHGVKIHYARKCKHKDKQQSFQGTVAADLHTMAIHKERQDNLDKVLCNGNILKNCFLFKYLGSMFSADGNNKADIRRRTGMAVTRCGQLRQVFSSPSIDLATKMKIYKCAVGSLFTYGNEAWDLNDQCLRTLNGANAGCLHRFTGKSRVEESRPATTTYSLCGDIRRRRLVWLGHILRMDHSRLVFKAAVVQHRSNRTGNLFMDAPAHRDLKELLAMAKCRKFWKKVVDRTNFKGNAKCSITNSMTTATYYDKILSAPLRTNRNTTPNTNPTESTNNTDCAHAHETSTSTTTTVHTNWQNILQPYQPKPKTKAKTQKPLSYAEKVAAYKAYCTLHYGDRPLNQLERQAMERDMGPIYKELLYLQAKPKVLEPTNAMRMVFNDSTATSSDLGINSYYSVLHDSNHSDGNFIPKRHNEHAILRTVTGIRSTPQPQPRAATMTCTQRTPTTQRSAHSCYSTHTSTMTPSTTPEWIMPTYNTPTHNTPTPPTTHNTPTPPTTHNTPPPKPIRTTLKHNTNSPSAPVSLTTTHSSTTKAIWQRYGRYRDRQPTNTLNQPHKPPNTPTTHPTITTPATLSANNQTHTTPTPTTRPIWMRYGRLRATTHNNPPTTHSTSTNHTPHPTTSPPQYYSDPILHTHTKTLYSDNYPLSPIYTHKHSNNMTHMNVHMTQSPIFKPYQQKHLQQLTHIRAKYPFLNETYIHQQYAIFE